VRKRYFLIILSLLVCLFIYLFYRTENTVINTIAIKILSIHNYVILRQWINSILPLHDLIIYSLPEGLWIFCITLTSQPFYVRLFKWEIKCIYLPLIFSICLEVFQLLNITNGQFDLIDILISIKFWALANYFFTYKEDKRNIFNHLNTAGIICIASYAIVYLSHVFK
jgi:hypothetical protein